MAGDSAVSWNSDDAIYAATHKKIVRRGGMLIGFAVLPIAHWQFYPGEVGVASVLGGLWMAIACRRITADLREDLAPGVDLKKIILNRFLFDRSFI